MLKEKLWGAWCRKCQTMFFRGKIAKGIGWPYCSDCSTGIDIEELAFLPRLEWIPPLCGDGILRTWDELAELQERSVA